MRIKKILYNLLMILPLIFTLIMLPILPDTIPGHYNLAGVVDRYGSKYESLILPILTIVMGISVKVIIRVNKNKYKETEGSNEYGRNEKAFTISGLGMLFVFNVITFIFLYAGYNSAANAVSFNIDSDNKLNISLGIFMIILGNIAPKIKKNRIIGLRTSWSMDNERAWAMSQRFGGISFIILGIIIIIANVFYLSNGEGTLFTIAALIIDGILSIIYSYIAYKKTKDLDK